MGAASDHPLLFLSHAGADTEAALDLARRVEATPAAREAGLRVWVDHRDLTPGDGWQRQLEEVIDQHSTAFAVLMGARGAINWVEAEVRVALSRTVRDRSYRFIPILLGEARSSDLPAFARQYHGVKSSRVDDAELLLRLVAALLQPSGTEAVSLVEHPFLGLESFGPDTAELFHGRKKETEEVIERLRRTNLLTIVGDSGSGKSSLARAGLLPRFRGGAFADRSSSRPDATAWQVVEMRPQGRPFERMVDALGDAARTAGVDAGTRGVLADWVRSHDPAKIRDALRESSVGRSKALLLVDQFEELWTLTPPAERTAFVEMLLSLIDGSGMECRVVLTMRRDYYNLCSQIPDLFGRLEAPNSPSKYQLRRMDQAGLRAAILEPLQLTGYRADPTIVIFANSVLDDVGDRPGDLALLEMALAETWRNRVEHGGNLLEAYVARGRVAGALANAAEDAFVRRLAGAPLDAVKGVFVRLVRLGDTGGTTRRIARRTEFTDETWALVQQLAAVSEGETESGHVRLIAISGESGSETIEIVHEALATQWPRYQAWLEDVAGDKRVFDRLIDGAAEWSKNHENSGYLARGTDLDAFSKFYRSSGRRIWLADVEARFVDASLNDERRLRSKSKWQSRVVLLAATVTLMASAGATTFWLNAQSAEEQRRLAEAQSAEAERQRQLAEQQARQNAVLSAENATLSNILRQEYVGEFRGATLDDSAESVLDASVTKLLEGRSRYEAVSRISGVPWYVIGVIHGLEGSYGWDRHLHNGDPLQARTVHVPRGRPVGGTPPFSWEESAVDAIRLNGMDRWSDWSIAGTLVMWERYNGLGYRSRGLRSPYIWACTDVYRGGRFISGVFYPQARAASCGAAAILRRLVDAGVIPVSARPDGTTPQ